MVGYINSDIPTVIHLRVMSRRFKTHRRLRLRVSWLSSGSGLSQGFGEIKQSTFT